METLETCLLEVKYWSYIEVGNEAEASVIKEKLESLGASIEGEDNGNFR